MSGANTGTAVAISEAERAIGAALSLNNCAAGSPAGGTVNDAPAAMAAA